MVGPKAKRKTAQAIPIKYSISQRRACRLLFLYRSVGRYKPLEKDTLIKERVVFHAQERKCFGYRRIHILIKKKGSM